MNTDALTSSDNKSTARTNSSSVSLSKYSSDSISIAFTILDFRASIDRLKAAITGDSSSLSFFLLASMQRDLVDYGSFCGLMMIMIVNQECVHLNQ